MHRQRTLIVRRPDVPHEVVLAARQGDERAFERIVELHQKSVFGIAWRMTHDVGRAEDLTQETFLRAWRKLHTFDVSKPLRPWLLRLATNVCINKLRKKRAPVVALGEDEDASAPEPQAREPEAIDMAEQHETRAILEAAIGRLPDDYRLVVTLRHVEEMAYDEIADTLGWPLGTVKVRLHRARERLRQMLESTLGDPA